MRSSTVVHQWSNAQLCFTVVVDELTQASQRVVSLI